MENKDKIINEFLNSLWHDASETPDLDRRILYDRAVFQDRRAVHSSRVGKVF